MFRRFVIGTLVLLLSFGALASGAGIWLTFGNPDFSGLEAVEPAVLSAADKYREVATLDVVLAAEVGEHEQFFTCRQDDCKVAAQPLAIPSNAVFDGQAWYYYAEDGGLHRQTASGEDTLIVSPTDLVTPRGIIPHASGKVAYWLDSTVDTKKNLTELWVYDVAEGGTHVVAEKLVASDIVTDVRWNSAGTNLFFVADSGEGEVEKLEFIVVNAGAPLIQARFVEADIGLLQEAITRGVIDVNTSGQAVAFTYQGPKGDTLYIAREGAAIEITPLVGTVPFVEWASEGTLIYVIQRNPQMQFVEYADATHTILGKENGQLAAAKISDGGEAIAYISSFGAGRSQLHVFEIGTNLSRLQSSTVVSGSVRIVAAKASSPTVAGVTSELTDGQIISFIDKQAEYILGENTRATRVVMTDQVNVVLLDYATATNETGRILLTIHDAVHPEWVVSAKYEAQGGQWQRISGRGEEPTPKRLYEWEYSAKQWVLKATLDK